MPGKPLSAEAHAQSSPQYNSDNEQGSELKKESSTSLEAGKGLDVGEVDPHIEKRARRKIDLIVIPLVGMFYLLSFLDRSNIGNARVAGLQTDLKMSNKQYSIALTMTYVPYIAVELPANLFMKRFGANKTLPTMITLWGIATASQGAVKSYGGLLTARFFIGLCEGGMFPGIVLYLSSFYKRHHLQLRVAMMLSTASLAGAFSGLLAAAIENMDGDRGLSGWAWIFVLEGVFTSCFGIFSFFVLPRTPADTLILTPEEAAVYTQALRQDFSGDEEIEPFKWSYVARGLTDPFVLALGIPLFFLGTTLYGLAFFAPTIVAALGNSPSRTQLLSVPPFACSFVLGIGSSYFADRYKRRGATTAIFSIIAMVGYIIFLVTPKRHADYAALYLQVIGVYGAAPPLVTWVSNNVQPFYKRATAIAFAFVMTNAGGILSTWIFTDTPRFRKATRLNLAMAIGMAVFGIGLDLYLRNENRKKRALVKAQGGEETIRLNDTVEQRLTLGDKHPLFMYTL